MKFGPDVLIEIMSIIQSGLSEGRDVSQQLRDIDVTVEGDVLRPSKVILSEEYKRSRK